MLHSDKQWLESLNNVSYVWTDDFLQYTRDKSVVYIATY